MPAERMEVLRDSHVRMLTYHREASGDRRLTHDPLREGCGCCVIIVGLRFLSSEIFRESDGGDFLAILFCFVLFCSRELTR